MGYIGTLQKSRFWWVKVGLSLGYTWGSSYLGLLRVAPSTKGPMAYKFVVFGATGKLKTVETREPKIRKLDENSSRALLLSGIQTNRAQSSEFRNPEGPHTHYGIKSPKP